MARVPEIEQFVDFLEIWALSLDVPLKVNLFSSNPQKGYHTPMETAESSSKNL